MTGWFESMKTKLRLIWCSSLNQTPTFLNYFILSSYLTINFDLKEVSCDLFTSCTDLIIKQLIVLNNVVMIFTIKIWSVKIMKACFNLRIVDN